MTVRVTPLAQSAYVPNAETDVYVAPNTTIIDACKSTAVAAGTVTLRVVPANVVSGNQHIQGWKQFALNETYTWPELAGQVLASGDRITAICTAPSAVTLRLSGRQVT